MVNLIDPMWIWKVFVFQFVWIGSACMHSMHEVETMMFCLFKVTAISQLKGRQANIDSDEDVLTRHLIQILSHSMSGSFPQRDKF